MNCLFIFSIFNFLSHWQAENVISLKSDVKLKKIMKVLFRNEVIRREERMKEDVKRNNFTLDDDIMQNWIDKREDAHKLADAIFKILYEKKPYNDI